MANTKISNLTSYTTPLSADVIPIVDTANTTTKKVTIANLLNVLSSLFTIKDSTDTTKKVAFDVSGVTTATTRTLTIPNVNTTIVGTDATQTLTNKTLSTGTKMSLGSDATGDIYYNSGSGTIARLPISTDGKILKLSSGLPSWQTETVTNDASTTVKGIVEAATSSEVTAGTATGGTGAVLVVTPDALAASTPVFNGSALTNLPLTPFYHTTPYSSVASGNMLAASTNTAGTTLYLTSKYSTTQLYVFRYSFDTTTNTWYQTHSTFFSIGAGNITDVISGVTEIGSYIYVSFTQNSTGSETWRLSATDLTGATQCTYSGGSPSYTTNYRQSYTDGTDLYICSTTTTWKHYTISGTTLTATTDVTTLSGATASSAVWDGTNVIFGGNTIYKYTASGSSVSSITRNFYDGQTVWRGTGIYSGKNTVLWAFGSIGTSTIVCLPVKAP